MRRSDLLPDTEHLALLDADHDASAVCVGEPGNDVPELPGVDLRTFPLQELPFGGADELLNEILWRGFRQSSVGGVARHGPMMAIT